MIRINSIILISAVAAYDLFIVLDLRCLIDSSPSVTASQQLKFHLRTHGMYDTGVSNHVKLISLIA